ncbi:hypothetical protein ACLIKD_05655 [Azonexus sp. IMCC34842]
MINYARSLAQQNFDFPIETRGNKPFLAISTEYVFALANGDRLAVGV